MKLPVTRASPNRSNYRLLRNDKQAKQPVLFLGANASSFLRTSKCAWPPFGPGFWHWEREREKERKQNKWRRQLLLCFHYDGEPFISALQFFFALVGMQYPAYQKKWMIVFIWFLYSRKLPGEAKWRYDDPCLSRRHWAWQQRSREKKKKSGGTFFFFARKEAKLNDRVCVCEPLRLLLSFFAHAIGNSLAGPSLSFFSWLFLPFAVEGAKQVKAALASSDI